MMFMINLDCIKIFLSNFQRYLQENIPRCERLRIKEKIKYFFEKYNICKN